MRSETLRDSQKASPRTSGSALDASGSALEALGTRLQRNSGVQVVILRPDFERQMERDCGDADLRKSMLSPRREHRFWSPEGPKMDPRTLPKRFCEATRAEEERTEHPEARPKRSEPTFARRPAHFRPSSPGPKAKIGEGVRRKFE